MATLPTAAAAAAASPAKPAKAKKDSSKPKAVPTHPPVAAMVKSAIGSLKERNGSSLQAIKKYIAANYKVDIERVSPFIRKHLKVAVTKGLLVQSKGKGASGSFKLKSKEAKSGGAAGASGKPKVAKAKKAEHKNRATKKPKTAKPKSASPAKPKAAKPAAAAAAAAAGGAAADSAKPAK
ncbi:PREDICTED: histone H1E-like, partial [Rhagoletis zephyria]|uniref:histone H1E-like n=1 Tax=Rhagoletis zephyria TaxID=28612 RepID=UPI0008118281